MADEQGLLKTLFTLNRLIFINSPGAVSVESLDGIVYHMPPEIPAGEYEQKRDQYLALLEHALLTLKAQAGTRSSDKSLIYFIKKSWPTRSFEWMLNHRAPSYSVENSALEAPYISGYSIALSLLFDPTRQDYPTHRGDVIELHEGQFHLYDEIGHFDGIIATRQVPNQAGDGSVTDQLHGLELFLDRLEQRIAEKVVDRAPNREVYLKPLFHLGPQLGIALVGFAYGLIAAFEGRRDEPKYRFVKQYETQADDLLSLALRASIMSGFGDEQVVVRHLEPYGKVSPTAMITMPREDYLKLVTRASGVT